MFLLATSARFHHVASQSAKANTLQEVFVCIDYWYFALLLNVLADISWSLSIRRARDQPGLMELIFSVNHVYRYSNSAQKSGGSWSTQYLSPRQTRSQVSRVK